MRSEKKKRLDAKGWRVGSAGEFLGLSTQEQDLIDIRLRLADGLKRRRLRRRVTQANLARAVHSSQSRIAKMEAGDPTVSIDLLVRTLLALGASTEGAGCEQRHPCIEARGVTVPSMPSALRQLVATFVPALRRAPARRPCWPFSPGTPAQGRARRVHRRGDTVRIPARRGRRSARRGTRASSASWRAHASSATKGRRFLDLDPVDAHLLALADNRLGEEAGWDAPRGRPGRACSPSR